MFNLSVRCVQYSSKVESSILFTFVKLRNYVSLTAARTTSSLVGSVNSCCDHRHFQRFDKTSTRRRSKYTMDNLKEFRITDYDIIGFDLDGTLLRYNLNNMVPLEYKLLINYLVEQRNYPRVILDKQFDSEFVQKGLLVDADRGNLLKLSSDGVILKASHGTRFLSIAEIEKVYGMSKQWDVAQEYINDPLSAWNGPISEKLRTLLDYFDIASSLVFAHAVDALDEQETGTTDILQKNNYKIWPDILSGLIQIYTREHFASSESAYFEALKKNPEKYLLKTNEKVIECLQKLRASGKALYLLTGSNIDFANFTASYALGPNWRDNFNCVISFAKKPGFFHMQRQFLQIRDLAEVVGSEIPLQDELLAKGSSFSQGNWQQLKESLSKDVLGKDATTARCLYVGDNLIQDVFAPFTKASMETIAISEELLENDSNYEYRNIVKSSLWGSYFCVDGVPTLWSNIIDNYSQLCISHMDVVAEMPFKAKLLCKNKQGFFPNVPDDLLVR